MRAALEGHPANAGFLREEAALGVVFLTEEDDCSARSTRLFARDDPAMGPLESFRCTRFGVQCSEGGQTPDEMNHTGVKRGCAASRGVASGSVMLVDDVAPYREFLRGLKRDPRRVAVAGLVGPVGPLVVGPRIPRSGGAESQAVAHVCTYPAPGGGGLAEPVPDDEGLAEPAPRMHDFLGGFQDRSAIGSICEDDLAAGVVGIGELFRTAMGSPCLAVRPADVDPIAGGLQVDCLVEDVLGEESTDIGPCAAGASARPCWRIEEALEVCRGPQALQLAVRRDVAPDPATVTRMRCVVD
jgi:hypothetical protein